MTGTTAEMTVPPEIETTASPATEITVPTVTETAARPVTEMETVHPATGMATVRMATGMETARPATGTETARMATETAVRLAIEMADPLATGTADRSAETIIPEMIIPTASIRQPLLLR